MPLSMTATRTPWPRAPKCMRGVGADVRHGLGEIVAVVGHADHARDRGVTRELRQIGGVDAQHHRIGGQLHRSHDFRVRRRREDAIDDRCLFGQHLFARARFIRAGDGLADETHEHVDATGRAARLGCRTLRVARPPSVSMAAGRANDSQARQAGS